jgi:NAD(P)-dependent dehydrogenase (short-subunit alcohol dehydrogenase family)
MRDKCAHPENCFLEERDLTADIAGLPAYAKSLREKHGKFYGLALCHGITEIRPMQLIELDTLRNMFDVDYFSHIMLAKGFADRRNNIGKGASIVAVSSLGAFISERGMIEYSGAKAALSASMKVLGREVSSNGIRVNCISPSMIKTPMVMSEEIIGVRKEGENLYPFGYGEPADVANMIAYLLSDAAKWITTQNYIVDCGVI